MNEAIKVLWEEYQKVAGRIFADFFMRNNAGDEAKKSIEAGDFMLALITGKNIKEKWELGKSEDYILLGKLAQAMNKLGEK
jgi:hypothetical protein